jgi:hypothetical protein
VPPTVRLSCLEVLALGGGGATVVTEEVAAKVVLVIGAVAGGAINLLFMPHFQEMARGHFAVERLEKRYGPEAVRAAYERTPSDARAASTQGGD